MINMTNGWPMPAAAVALVSGLAAVSCRSAAPESPAPALPTCPEQGIARAPCETPYDIAPHLTNPDVVKEALVREYPPGLREAGIGGRAVVWFFIDQNGRSLNVLLKDSSGESAIDRAALAVARTLRFRPARNGDRRVPVWVSMPITFSARRR